MKAYPVFLVGLERRRCVIVGGNHEAERKAAGLLDCAARVTLIAPELSEGLARLAARGRVEWIRRRYRRGDLRGAYLVIVAEPEARLHARVHREAEAAGVLVNAMDNVERSSFIAGSVVRRGDLVVAISTGGGAPALAVRLRQRLERELGPEYGELVALLASLRERIRAARPDFDSRRSLWYEIVDADLLDSLSAGRRDDAIRKVESLLGGTRA